MLVRKTDYETWSGLGLKALKICIVMEILIIIVAGYVKEVYLTEKLSTSVAMLASWLNDFKYLFEQGIFVSTVFLVGAKFLETRTLFSIGFDNSENSKLSFKGPDEENMVWIGKKYDSVLEAEAVARVLKTKITDKNQ